MKTFLFILWVVEIQALIINIENGKISGVEFEKYFAYRGIQYAIADRFSPPKFFNQTWNDVKEYNDYGDSCAQYSHFTYDYEGSENCLFLNVFVPKQVAESKESAPVIFFIHGGAFMFGSGDFYDPIHVMEYGKFILVTINYRLGILGFLSTEDEILPGNLGMKDQVEALKWTQRNIKAFNGDPEKVTIVGFSAGGASVQLHYMSPLSQGLFKNGISHSGTALDIWVTMENAKEKAYKIAEFANCPTNDHKKMVKCLKRIPSNELVVLVKHFQPFLYNPFSPLAVVVEPNNEGAFLSEHPRNLLKNGKFARLPWLLSQTEDEGNYPCSEFYSDEKILPNIEENWENLASSLLDYDGLSKDTEKKKKAARIIKDSYMNGKKISKENFLAFNDILTDRLFKSTAFQSIKLQSKYSASYFYHFRYKSLDGLSEAMGHTSDNIGISHGEDVLLIYKTPLRSIAYSDDERKMIHNLINMYYEFSMNESPLFDGTKIQAASSDNIHCLDIFANDNVTMTIKDESFGRVEFWMKIEKMLQDETRDEL